MAPKTNGSALSQAQEALAATNTQIAKLIRDREASLLEGDDAMLDVFDNEIDVQERLARRHSLRIRALEVRAEQDERERVAKRKGALIGRIEKKLSESDALVSELETLVTRMDRVFQQLISLREETLAAWPWSTVDQDACILTPAAIRTALQHELYRQGSRPFIGGSEFAPIQVSLTGREGARSIDAAACLVDPLSVVLQRGNQYASRVLRGGTVPAPEPPAPSPAREEAPAHV
jgi:hypothetical protein